MNCADEVILGEKGRRDGLVMLAVQICVTTSHQSSMDYFVLKFLQILRWGRGEVKHCEYVFVLHRGTCLGFCICTTVTQCVQMKLLPSRKTVSKVFATFLYCFANTSGR